MNSIVRELQKDSLDSSISLTNVLRKALVVARKFRISEFESWCNKELNGYADGSDIPSYRHIDGKLMVQNPMIGLVPLIFEQFDIADLARHRVVGRPIAELEELCDKPEDKGILTMSIAPSIVTILLRWTDGIYPVYVVGRTQLKGIVESVRTVVLEWALKLEEQGILGVDMGFTEREKQVAPSVVFNIGRMENSQIQHDTVGSTQTLVSQSLDLKKLGEFLSLLEDSIPELSLDKDSTNELKSELGTIEAQTKSPKPKINIIKESLLSIRTILEGIAGNVLAAKLLEYYPALIEMFKKAL